LHVIGDFVYAYVALLGGDWSVLFEVQASPGE
jgi:hypothetical protein